MNRRLRRALQLLAAALLLVLAAGIAAPAFKVDRYAQRLQSSLERSLGRKVELEEVRFSLFKGPGFTVGRVIIHEDPAFGIEPVAYIEPTSGSMEVVPSLWSLLGGRFVIASITLNEASINLTKSGPASEWGRWNFSSIVNPSLIRTAPGIHVRGGRIHFKFGDTKNVFYLTETDLDLTPAAGGDWKISLQGRPARTDRPAQGLGAFKLTGRWYGEVGRADMDLAIDRAGLGEVTALIGGEDAGVHGTLTSRVHFAGPLNQLGIQGRLRIDDVHRWDLMPGSSTAWPLDISGRLDLIGQQIELHSATPGNASLPLSVHFRATDYLSQPHWAVSVNWNRFPVAPILELARHMGAQLPPKLKLTGTMNGAIGYSGQGSFQGALAFFDTALAIPDSPPLRFEQAHLVFDHGHARLSPALVRGGDNDEARIEADYTMDDASLNLEISTDGMKVQSLRAQAALAAVPCLEQIASGVWSGGLRYHRDAKKAGWEGSLSLIDAGIVVPGLAHPVQLNSAHVAIDGVRLAVDHIDAQAGKLAFTGEYRYEPETVRPHRVRLRANAWDAADLEAELMPTLRRSTNVFARALGRPMVTDWLRERNLEGTVQIDELTLGGTRLDSVRARVLWDVTHVQVENLQAALEGSALTGKLDVDLRGSRPKYKLAAKAKGLAWQSGKLDADGSLDTFGTGLQLATNLTAEGAFKGIAVDFGAIGTARNLTGAYTLSWQQTGARLRLTNLSLRTEDETYTGRGETQGDGRLVVLFTNGARETRMSGTLARLRIE